MGLGTSGLRLAQAFGSEVICSQLGLFSALSPQEVASGVPTTRTDYWYWFFFFFFLFFFLFRNFKHTYNLFGFRIFAGLPGLPGFDIFNTSCILYFLPEKGRI